MMELLSLPAQINDLLRSIERQGKRFLDHYFYSVRSLPTPHPILHSSSAKLFQEATE
jgi:hypothetical protein